MLFSTMIVFITSAAILLILNYRTSTLKRLISFKLLLHSLTMCDIGEMEKGTKIIYGTTIIGPIYEEKRNSNSDNGYFGEKNFGLRRTNNNYQLLLDIRIILETLKKNQFHYIVSRVNGIIINKNELILTRQDFVPKPNRKYMFVDYGEFEASWLYINIVFSLLVSILLSICWENDFGNLFHPKIWYL